MQEALIYIMKEESGRAISLPPEGGTAWYFDRNPRSQRAAVWGLCGSAPMNFGSWWAKVGIAGEEICLCAAKKRSFVGLGPQSTGTGREN